MNQSSMQLGLFSVIFLGAFLLSNYVGKLNEQSSLFAYQLLLGCYQGLATQQLHPVKRCK